MPRKLIIDADPGIGDALAIALAALDPSTPVPEPVPVCAVPGAVLLPSLLQPHEAEALATELEEAHAEAFQTAHRVDGALSADRIERAIMQEVRRRLRPSASSTPASVPDAPI